MPTPEEWRDLLNKRLDDRRPTIDRFEAYYEGQHRLAFATSKFREAFGNLFGTMADNWCQVVVDASVERLQVQGFRFGPDEDADDDAWHIWQANDMDNAAPMGFETAVVTGQSYLLVSPQGSEDEPDTPRITVEHPSEVIVANRPGLVSERLAAFKKWIDDDGYAMGTVYLPDRVFKWRSKGKMRRFGGKVLGSTKIDWVPRTTEDDVDEDGFAGDNPLGVVPMIPVLHRPTLRGVGRSDLKSVIPMQDAINKIVLDMIVASEFAAFRQRWASGIEVPIDPETGKPVRKMFDAAVDRVFSTENEGAKFGDFEASDLGNYVTAVEMIVQHVAAQTRTPPHYLLGQSGAFPSGESLKSTETGLVAKVRREMVTFGEPHEEAMRLAFKAKGDTEKASAVDAEIIWRDPESRSEAELVDGLVKLSTIGVPRRALWERLGATPQQIDRWESMAAVESLQAAAADNVRIFGPGGQGQPVDPNALPAPVGQTQGAAQ